MRRLLEVLKNKEFKLLAENFLSLSALKLISAVVPFIAIPHLIKVLSFGNYGVVVLGLSIITYFINIGVYGFHVSGARDVSINKSDLEYLNNKVSSILSTQVIIVALCTVLYTLIIYSVAQLNKYLVTYLLFIPYMWGEALFPAWFFQGIQKMKYITLVSSLVKLFFTFSVFLLIRSSSDYYLYPVIVSLGSIFALMFTLYVIYKMGVRVRLSFDRLEIINELKSNLVFFLNDVTPMLYNNTTQVVMGLVLPTNILGLFDAIRKIPTIVGVLMSAISNTVFPFFNRNPGSFFKFKKCLFVIYLGAILIPCLFYKILFKLFHITDGNLELSVLLILSLGMFGVALSSIYGSNYLIVNKKERYVLKATAVSSVAGFLLSYPLVKAFGLLGGAINIALAQLCLGCLVYLFSRKSIKKI